MIYKHAISGHNWSRIGPMLAQFWIGFNAANTGPIRFRCFKIVAMQLYRYLFMIYEQRSLFRVSYPVDTWCNNNVIITSKQRCDVGFTLFHNSIFNLSILECSILLWIIKIVTVSVLHAVWCQSIVTDIFMGSELNASDIFWLPQFLTTLHLGCRHTEPSMELRRNFSFAMIRQWRKFTWCNRRKMRWNATDFLSISKCI